MRAAALLALTVALSSSDVRAQEPGANADQLFQRLVTDWRQERLKLVTGKYKAEGFQESEKDKAPLFLQSAFDFKKGMKKEFNKREGIGGWWLQTPHVLADCILDDSPHVTVYKNEGKRSVFVWNMDARCVEGDGAFPDPYAATSFDDVTNYLQSLKSFVVTSKKGGVYCLERHFVNARNREFMTEYEVSEKYGFVFRRITQNYKGPAGTEWLPATHLYCRWERREGIQVPKSLEAWCYTSRRHMKLEFVWETVNSPILEKEFDLNSFGPPKGTPVVDVRGPNDTFTEVGKIGSLPEDLCRRLLSPR